MHDENFADVITRFGLNKLGVSCVVPGRESVSLLFFSGRRTPCTGVKVSDRIKVGERFDVVWSSFPTFRSSIQ